MLVNLHDRVKLSIGGIDRIPDPDRLDRSWSPGRLDQRAWRKATKAVVCPAIRVHLKGRRLLRVEWAEPLEHAAGLPQRHPLGDELHDVDAFLDEVEITGHPSKYRAPLAGAGSYSGSLRSCSSFEASTGLVTWWSKPASRAWRR